MNIAYVITESYCINPYNGIRVQAETWAEELSRQGERVVRINPWEKYNWEEFDIIHIFGPCEFILNFTRTLYGKNRNIVFSPIIDTIQSLTMYRLVSLWGSEKLRLASPNYTIHQASKYICHWFVRSNYELKYVHKGYSIPKEIISVIPLSYRLSVSNFNEKRESFCLHISKITDGRKNVKRLIQAAIDYNFNLVLAGSISNEADFKPLKSLIDTHENIVYLGRISDEELLDLYNRAKVFALPSINEGVGMVAVEAAACGCDIVITNFGGPKEYYNGMAKEVNPYNIAQIGEAVLNYINGDSSQPQLYEHIKNNYSLSKCVYMMRQKYMQICTMLSQTSK